MMERCKPDWSIFEMISDDEGEYVEYDDMQAALAAKDQELARVTQENEWITAERDCANKLLDSAIKDGQEKVVEIHNLQHQLDTLLGEAVWAMERLDRDISSDDFKRQQAFLARPDVQAWQERQGKETHHGS